VGWFLHRLKGKPSLLYWLPGSFTFKLKEPDMLVRTDALTIQNIGRQTAKDIEIIHKEKLDHFEFSTPIDFAESTSPSGEHVIKIASLGPKEHINIQLLSHAKLPMLLNVRSAEGQARAIQVQLQRIFSKSIQALAVVLMAIGGGFVLYWVVRSVVFLSKAIGIV
jgi:hypothetical protein